MKFKEYIHGLQQLAIDYPEILEMEVFYAEDDEGNGYQSVGSNGTIVRFDDENKNNPSLIGVLGDDVSIEECNGVIIN